MKLVTVIVGVLLFAMATMIIYGWPHPMELIR